MNRAKIGHELPPYATAETWDSLARDLATAVAVEILQGAGDGGDDWFQVDRLRASSSPAVRHVVNNLERGRAWSVRSVAQAVGAYFELDRAAVEAVRHRVGRMLPSPAPDRDLLVS